MKAYSNNKPSVYDASGNELRIRWGIQEIVADEQTTWEANEALCSVFCNRSQIIEAIIGSVYDTGAEIALINNQADKPEAYAEYQAFRALAKQLADGWLNKDKP
jgi:hypothetical protein